MYKLIIVLSIITLCTLSRQAGYVGNAVGAIFCVLFLGIWKFNGQQAFEKKLPWFSWQPAWCAVFLFFWSNIKHWQLPELAFKSLGINEAIIPLATIGMQGLGLMIAIPGLMFIAHNLGDLAGELRRLSSGARFLSLRRHCFSFNSRWVAAYVLLYLLLPNFCFLIGWVKWYLAGGIIAALCIGAVCILKNMPVRRFEMTLGDALALLAGIAMCAAIADCMGFMGQVKQSWDFIYRNAFYHTLVSEPWPIFSERGEYFVYYHTFWLVPALISKLCSGFADPLHILTLWAFLGLLAIFIPLYVRHRAKALGLLILILFIGSLYDAPKVAHNIAKHVGCHPNVLYTSLWGCVVRDIYHTAIPALVVLSFCYSRLLKPATFYFISALMVSSSPLAAIAFLPLLAVMTWPVLSNPQKLKKLCTGVTWLAIPLLLSIAYYFSLCNEAAGFRLITSEYDEYRDSFQQASKRILHYAYITALMLTPMVIILRRRIFSPYALIVAGMILMLPFCWIGRWMNELLFKGSIVMFFMLAVIYAQVWQKSAWHMRFFLGTFFLVTSFRAIYQLNYSIETYTRDPALMEKNISNEWQKHINHPDDEYYCHFFGKTPSPNVFYNLPGSSPVNK